MNTQFGRGALFCLLALVLAGCPTESDSGGGPAGDTDPPAPVGALTGTAGNGRVNIEWIDPYDLDLDHIGITWTPGGDTPQTVTSGIQAAAVEGLTNGTEYTFTVQAVDRAGNGSVKKTLSLSPDANIQHPDEVTKLEGAAGKGELTVTWADPAVDFDHVEVTWTPGDGSQTVEAGSQSARITGLTNDTAYTVTIKTVNGSGVKSPGRAITLVPSFVGLWTAATGSPFGTTVAVNKIAWGGTTGNEKFVAVGASGTLASSADGETWASATSTFTSTAINNIAWGGTTGSEKFVAVGASGKMAYSSDGATWTAIDATTSTFTASSAINGIAWGGTSGNEKFVAVGAAGKMAYSSDGTSWTAISPGSASTPGDTTFGNSSIYRITWGGTSGNEKFVAVGDSGKMAYSTNGTSWTAVTDSTFGTSSAINGIAWGGTSGNEKFVALRSTSMIARSVDGVTWTAVDSGLVLNYNLNSIAWGGNRFVAVGALSTNTSGKIFWSPDGLSWYPAGDSTFGGSAINGVAWGNGKFVAVGAAGKIAWAAP